MLTYVLYGLFILACIVLVVAVLLQPGKADAGALFSSSVSSTAFGPRGTQTILAKITIGAAALFMLLGLTLSLPVITGTRSVLQSQPADGQPAPQPSPAAAPAASPAQPATEGAQPANTNEAANATPTPSASPTPASSPKAKPSPQKKK